MTAVFGFGRYAAQQENSGQVSRLPSASASSSVEMGLRLPTPRFPLWILKREHLKKQPAYVSYNLTKAGY